MNFAEIIKSREAEGKEKHVPVIEINKDEGGTDVIGVIVGKDIPHPNTVEHHIAWAEVFGTKKDGQVIALGRSDFAPIYTSPKIRIQVPITDFKSFCALIYCNVHGIWENCLEL